MRTYTTLRGLSLFSVVVFGVAMAAAATELPSTSKTKKSPAKTTSTKHVVKSSSARTGLPLRSANPYLGAIVVDAATGQVLFENNADAPGFPASVTKLMDMMVLLDRIQAGQLSLTNMVTVTTEASKVGGTQVWLAAGEVFSLEDLMYALMIQSANDSAVAMAIHVAGSKEGFVELMNKKAAELGMTNTTYASVHGLPPTSGQKADTSTPRDLAKLACALIAQHPEILKYTSTQMRPFREASPEHKVIMRNHNHLLHSLAGCDGLKTGFISAGGFSLVATAQRNGRRVVAVVLGSQDRKVRDARAAELIGKGFAALPPPPPPPPPPALTNLPPAALVTEEPPPPPPRSPWLTYSLIGLAAGLVLLGIVSVVIKKRSPREF